RAASTIRDSRARARTNRQPCDFDGELTERAGQSPAVADYSAFLAIAERNSRAVIDRGNDNGQRALMLRVIHERDRKFWWRELDSNHRFLIELAVPRCPLPPTAGHLHSAVRGGSSSPRNSSVGLPRQTTARMIPPRRGSIGPNSGEAAKP